MKPEGPILCFAPEGIVLNQLTNAKVRSEIVTTDLNSVDVDFPGEDIQALSFKDDSYSAIVCNHVLEHVPEDGRAIAECARILKRGGIAVFTIPGDFHNARTRQFKEPDDNGHFRHYGMDLLKLFQSKFTIVKAIDMSAAANRNWHVRSFDYAFVCYK